MGSGTLLHSEDLGVKNHKNSSPYEAYILMGKDRNKKINRQKYKQDNLILISAMKDMNRAV